MVIAVHRSPDRGLEKQSAGQITLIEGEGVEGDVHRGRLIRHAARMRKDPTQPNLRQVHLLQSELQDELASRGMAVTPGAMGENVTTQGVDLLGLAPGTLLALGDDAVVKVTGLRNPCVALDSLHDGLMEATLDRDENGELIRRAGVMSVVVCGGVVRDGDVIRQINNPPPGPLRPV